MFRDLDNPESSPQLKQLLYTLYGNEISIDEFVDSILGDTQEHISLLEVEGEPLGYCIWLIDIETDEDNEESRIFVVDDLVLKSFEQVKQASKNIPSLIKEKALQTNCSLIDLSLPSQSFWLIPVFAEQGFETTVLRVSKELVKKTEFVSIYTNITQSLSPQLIEVMVSKDDKFHLELIEEPKDYRRLLNENYTPEVVSIIFDLDNYELLDLTEKVKEIAEWQEYAVSLIYYFE